MSSRVSIYLLVLLALASMMGSNAANAQDRFTPDSLALDFRSSDKKVQYIYWIDQNDRAIKRGNIESLIVEEVISVSDKPLGLAVDEERNKLYWTTTEGKIMRANLDGSEIETLIEGLCGIGFLTDIVLDVEENKMYWGNDSDCQVMLRRANLDGSELENLLYGPFPPSGIALDSVHQRIYWTSGAILRSNLGGTEWEIIIENLEYAPGIAIDYYDNKVYWTEHSGSIRRADLTGADIENVLTDLQTPFKLELDLQDGKIYWTERDAGKIRRANLDGTEIEDIFTDLADPTDLVLTFKGETSTGVGSRRELPKAYKLTQNYPNPFEYSTRITFDLSRSTPITLKLYDITGREIAILASKVYSAGTHSISWDSLGMPSGIYICRLQAGGFSDYITMVLQR